MKAETEVNKESKPGDESMKETDYCWLDELVFVDDISMDFGVNWDAASYYDEYKFFKVHEFMG